MNVYQKKISKSAKHIKKHRRISWSAAKRISTKIFNWLVNDRACHLIIGIDLSSRPDISAEKRVTVGIL